MNTKMKALREASTEALQEELDALHRELFSLRMQRGGMENTVKPHAFSAARHKIARIKTIINERKAEDK